MRGRTVFQQPFRSLSWFKKGPLFIWLPFILLCSNMVAANEWHRAGLGIRGSYWDFINNGGDFRVETRDGFTYVNIGGYGGALYMYSRIADQWFLEFSLGGVAAVEEHEWRFDGEHVDVTVVAPMLMGVRFNFLPLYLESTLQPYASAGGGAYWISDIHVRDTSYHDEEVIIDSTTRPGVYAGGGLNFLLGRHFALNFDMKYHWVDFPGSQLNNGFEFAIGFAYRWGTYRPKTKD